MNLDTLMTIGIFAAAIIGFVVFVSVFFSKLYHRTSQDEAFVRTGLGGAKVISEGGAIVLPVVHSKTPVSLKTQKLEVSRRQTEALITKDSLRADVTVEFFVRVEKEDESIKSAAQTLGVMVNDPTELKKLVEGKFVDALRAAAAKMELAELHQNRSEFVQQVRQGVSEDLKKNGLELESASLVGLDQTDKKYFNPENTFDAAGLAKISKITEERRKERFDIEQSTEVSIAERRRDAKMQTLNIERETRNAEITQGQEIAEKEAEAQALIARKQAESHQKSEQARIDAEKQIGESEVQKTLAIDLANQQRETKSAEESRKKSAAEAAAAEERAKAVAAEEKVKTAQAVEVAERGKQVELVEASKVAEKAAIGVTVAAQAEKDAAVTRADAIKTVAEAEAQAEIIRADAKAKSYEVEAAGQEKINNAQNVISDRIIDMQIRMRVIEVLPQIIEQSVKPLNNIDSIKLVEVGGLNGNNGGGAAGEASQGNLSLPQQVVNASLTHRVQSELVDNLLSQVGIRGGGNLQDLTKSVVETLAAAPAAPAKPTPAAASAPKEIVDHTR